MNIYVNCKAAQNGDGSEAKPFSTIQEAADIAKPGDKVIVAPGIYRENVDPKCAGTEDARIEYISEKKGEAIITGAEVVKDWTKVSGNVWSARVSNSIFGGYNPYTTLVRGDWLIATYIAHIGDVFLDGKSMYEVTEMDGVTNPKVYDGSWDRDFTVYTWYAKQDEEKDETVFYANFQGLDPNEHNIEISARRNCFYPQKEGIGYITLSGFTVRVAATQWAPPTAYQEGMVGPHWSKGWIIEDCDISESKCSGISLGKYLQPENDNKWLKTKMKDGTQTERDCICQAQVEGWTKENIGSHIVRRCNIHDCGQTGIVGHLGGVFSIIEDNHIHHINNKQNLAGAEIGGIKMHAAIDVIIRRNHFHHCTRGLWLDWQAQGTRVSQNFFHDNTLPYDYLVDGGHFDGHGEDIFVEVSHGPTLIDNNIMLSDNAMKLATQGVAAVHNLVAGSITAVGRGTNNGTIDIPSPRYTPYHMKHRTEVAGFMTILHGDNRFYNNVFVQRPVRAGMAELEKNSKDNDWTDNNTTVGTSCYEGYQTEEEYLAMFEGYCGMGSPASNRYYMPLPVWMEGNVYLNGAKAYSKEVNPIVCEDTKAFAYAEEENGEWVLKTNVMEYVKRGNNRTITTDILGMAFEPEQKFENPDGTPITFNVDYYGNSREAVPMPGPFEK